MYEKNLRAEEGTITSKVRYHHLQTQYPRQQDKENTCEDFYPRRHPEELST